MNTAIPPKRQPLIETFIHRNDQINLSAIRETHDIYHKHILDSLELTQAVDLTQLSTNQGPVSSLLDVGTGGGFPLLPLATMYPQFQCVGLDARKKKCEAVNAMIKTLDLENVITVWSRIEEYDHKADIVTARAVTYADKLFHWTLPLVKPGGYLVIYKLFTQEEDNLILSLIRQKNLTLTKLHHYTLAEDDIQRVIYVIKNG